MTDDRNMHEADDARLDALIVREARADRVAPPAPREEMWTEIRARLDAERAAAAAPAGTIPFRAPRTTWTRHIPWGLVAAGTLIVGVGIGRLTRPDDVAPVARSGEPAAVATVTPPAASTAPASPIDTMTAPGVATTSATNPSLIAAPTRVAAATESETRSAGRAAARDDDRSAGASRTYGAVATVHLAAAEALLTSFRAGGDAVSADTAVAAWAGDLLGTTRMLLDSPATRDPKTKHLLEDLELVLAQIARLQPHAPASGRGVDDHALIDQAIRERQMLTRLRAAGA